MTLSTAEVEAQLRALGVREGGVLLVHTSFRAVRPIEDGPRGLIEALQRSLGPNGTLVMPTMTDGESIFDPRTTPTTDMGITAETFWRMPGVLRSTHPGGSFAAVGPHAEKICAPQPLAPPHGIDSPPGRVYELGGQVLLLGVSHSENTTLHVAESIAKVPYAIEHPCVVAGPDGHPTTIMIAETDHCCRQFNRAGDRLRALSLEREGKVGHADARLSDSQAVVRIACELLAEDSLAFLCGKEMHCEECDRARSSVNRPLL